MFIEDSPAFVLLFHVSKPMMLLGWASAFLFIAVGLSITVHELRRLAKNARKGKP